MENNDISITNILVDNEETTKGNNVNPFQRDTLLERSKSKTKKDFNKFLFNTAQRKINKKLTISNPPPSSTINKFEYIDKKDLLTEEKENVDTINNIDTKEKDFPNKLDDSLTEFKDANEHYSVIIPDDSEIIEDTKDTETKTSFTENILDNSLYITSHKPSVDDIARRNEIDSKRIETIVNSLGNMNENVKRRILSHISKTPNVLGTTTSTTKPSSTYESLLKKYNDVKQSPLNSSKSLKESNIKQEVNDEQSFTSNIPLNKNYRNLVKKYSDSNLSEKLSFNSLKQTSNSKKHQSLSGSLISRSSTQIQSPKNRNKNEITNLDDTLNDNLTLTLNETNIPNTDNILDKNDSNKDNELFTTPFNLSKHRNSSLYSNNNYISNSNTTKSLDRGRTSYLNFLNDETSLNKNDLNTPSNNNMKSLNYENFLKSPVNTPSKMSELLISNKNSTPPSLIKNNNKLPTTAYSANSFFEKSNGSLLKINSQKKPNSHFLLFESINKNDMLVPTLSSTSSKKPDSNMEFERSKEDEDENNNIINLENSILKDDNDNNDNNNNNSIKLGFYSPILDKNLQDTNNDNNHQRTLSEVSQPSLASFINASSPTNFESLQNSNSNDNHSRKRPANTINPTSDFSIKDDADQSLIILSDTSNQNTTKNISSNKKTKIKSPRNSNLDLNSQPSTSNGNTTSIYTESQIEAIKKELIEKYEKQLEEAKRDCMEWEQRCIESNNKHKEIEDVLEEYEVTITRMIQDSQKEKERQELKINELLQERSYLQESSEIMETSFKELRLKFEEFKTQNEIFSKNEELMKQTITSLQNDVLCASQRYEQIKSHAEEKLEMANIEIAKVRNDFDKELSAMKAKLLRKELDSQSLNQKIKALQEQINIKTKENEELATICDALVSKLEN